MYDKAHGGEVITLTAAPAAAAPAPAETPEESFTPETPEVTTPEIVIPTVAQPVPIAVHFWNGMTLSYSAARIDDFFKAVFSVWFRVPQASLDAALAATPDPQTSEFDIFGTYYPALSQIIPLVTFGSVEAATPIYGNGSGVYPTSPSFIGVNCVPNGDGVPPTLAVNLQMSNNTTFDNPPQRLYVQNPLITRYDAFYMRGYGRQGYTSDPYDKLVVTADKWHHALISFDLSQAINAAYSTDFSGTPLAIFPGGPTFMWAFDDEDQTNWSLIPSSAQNYNLEPPGSGFVPSTPVPMSQITTQSFVEEAGGDVSFNATWSPVPIKSSGNGFGLPTSLQFGSSVYEVELAEFQMFTGVTLDTSVEANRRLFVNAKGLPADPGKPIHFFGKEPDVSLTRTAQNWLGGANLGKAGKLTKTGKIKVFFPNPQLGK
jgi:hypothetical protein